MHRMKLVIDINEDIYKAIQRRVTNPKEIINQTDKAIANGIPLPKDCGRLGDLDALEQEMINGIKAGNYEDGYDKYAHINNVDDCVDCVRYANTIIEVNIPKKRYTT